MKTNFSTPSVMQNKTKKPGLNRISDDAFYLITLAMLLKKEHGKSCLKQYLMPGNATGSSRKSAA